MRYYFINDRGLKAQLVELETGGYCLTRYSYNSYEMQNRVVEQHMVASKEEALEIMEHIYNRDCPYGPMPMQECSYDEFIKSFHIEPNYMERASLVKAMEFIARQINDETVFEGWLMNGVADGDIEYGDLEWDDGSLDDYVEDNDTFRELMKCFLRRMNAAYKSGGLYCDGVCTEDK